MARTKKGTPPSYRRHVSSGQAIVTLPQSDGRRKDVLLGPYGSPESYAEYRRILKEWEAGGHRAPEPDSHGAQKQPSDLTVNELMLRWLDHVDAYYVKDGKPTSEPDTIRQALRFVKELYGHTLAREFGPLALKAVRQAMVDHPITRTRKVKDPTTGKGRKETKVLRVGLARKYVNKQVDRIKRMFAWAVAEELLPANVHAALLRVEGLRKGKSPAREKPRVKPVSDASVEAVLPLVPPTIRTMIEVHRFCGGRPQDIVLMRACDLDMTGPVWEYRPQRYKTEHHNEDDNPDQERIVFLGPKAQALLKPYLTLNTTDYLFSPKRAEEQRHARQREDRKTPLWPAHLRRQECRRAKRPRAALRDYYDVASYRRAIRRACLKAGIPIWHPNQLRHSAGTAIRKRYGLEASQACLGHAELGVTQVYAEVDRETARRVMTEMG